MRSAATVQLPFDSAVLVSTSSLYNSRNCASPGALCAPARGAVVINSAMAETAIRALCMAGVLVVGNYWYWHGMPAVQALQGGHSRQFGQTLGASQGYELSDISGL